MDFKDYGIGSVEEVFGPKDSDPEPMRAMDNLIREKTGLDDASIAAAKAFSYMTSLCYPVGQNHKGVLDTMLN